MWVRLSPDPWITTCPHYATSRRCVSVFAQYLWPFWKLVHVGIMKLIQLLIVKEWDTHNTSLTSVGVALLHVIVHIFHTMPSHNCETWLDSLCSNILSYSWQIKRASNNCIHQTGTCTLAIERRLGPLENHEETIYKTPPYPREKCCSEDRPTSMLLDVFPIITPLTRSKWQEIIHIKRKTKEEREPDLQPHWEENFSGELGMYRAQSQTTMTTQLHSSPIRTQQVSGASQKPHSSRVSQYSHHLFPNPKMTQVTFTFKDKSHWRDIQLWNSSWCLCLSQPDPCIYNLPKSIVVVFTQGFRVS